jgi:predicted ATPase
MAQNSLIAAYKEYVQKGFLQFNADQFKVLQRIQEIFSQLAHQFKPISNPFLYKISTFYGIYLYGSVAVAKRCLWIYFMKKSQHKERNVIIFILLWS